MGRWDRLRKYVLASKSLLRRYSLKVKWMSLVPDLVIMFTTLPVLHPYSAENEFVVTLNSWVSSTAGTYTTPPQPPATFQPPSSRKAVVPKKPPPKLRNDMSWSAVSSAPPAANNC